MITSIFPFVLTILTLLSMLAAGVYWVLRGYSIFSSNHLREIFMWGGGFTIYAIIDYYVMMH